MLIAFRTLPGDGSPDFTYPDPLPESNVNKLTIITALIVLAAIPIAAGQLLPWWAALLVLVVEITVILAFAPRLIALLVKARLVRMFQERSRVLKGAEVLVHQVTETAAPEPDQRDDDEASPSVAPARHVMIDFTLTPAAGSTGEYGPSELSLIGRDADESDTSEENAAFTERVRLVGDNGEETSCDKFSGPARFRIWFGLPAGLTGAARFRYYFATFGSLSLP
jgi:hypothetical protein